MKFIIIGQGLAGTLLAFELLERGHHVQIIDDGHESSSSLVAAGMWNPVSFRNFHESWMASAQLESVQRVYPKLEEKLSTKFYHPARLVRIFQNNEEANHWDERSTHPVMMSYLSDESDNEVSMRFKNSFGHGVIEHAGWLDVSAFINSSKTYFIKEQVLKSDHVASTPEIEEQTTIIHCVGWKSIYSELFSWVPIVPNKGEVLTLKVPDHGIQSMINFGRFVIPVTRDHIKLGATYELNEPDLNPSSKAESDLINDLNEVAEIKFEKLEHLTGFRPTTPDRKPLLGPHPEYPHQWIFNGFGSKGVMMIPFFANHLADVLESKRELMTEVNVFRYWNKTVQSYQSLVSNFKF